MTPEQRAHIGLVDSHCHLAGSEFAGDLEAVVARAREAGVERCFVMLGANDHVELQQASRLTACWPEVRFAIGVHPHAAGTYGEAPDQAVEAVAAAMALQPGCRAVGEIGLDYHYNFAPRAAQQEVFRGQLQLARARGLPVVIHTRDAEDDTFGLLAAESAGETGGVVHCFTGDRAMARRTLDAGFYVSLSGIVTFPRALELKEVARVVPLDRLLVETDSPYLAPVPHRGRRNEPALVGRVAEVIADLRGRPVEEIVQASAENFLRLFRP